MFRRLVEWIAKPRPFESRKLYKRLGVLTAKKFIFWFYLHVIGLKPLPWVYMGYLGVLQEMYDFTIKAEVLHLFFFAIMTCQTILNLIFGIWLGVFILISMNVVINLYPIFVQRYNRLRIVEVMSKNK